MRIVSWNCHHGECRNRASQIDPEADIVVLQECTRPVATDSQCCWFETAPSKGVGVVSTGRWQVRPVRTLAAVRRSAYPVEITGPLSFHMLAVWAQNRPNYVRAMMDALDRHRKFLGSAPSMIVGDFNINFRDDKPSLLADRLNGEFGLVSAFRKFAERSGILHEKPTYYHYRHESRPFHIDYCFIPKAWESRLRSVEISGFSECPTSDHRPVTIDMDLESI